MWPPVGWVINSPFVRSVPGGFTNTHPPQPQPGFADCALPQGWLGELQQARVTWWQGLSWPLCCVLLPDRWLLFPAGEGGTSTRGPTSPLPRVSLVREWVGASFVCSLPVGPRWLLAAPRGNRWGGGGRKFGARSATSLRSAHWTQFPCLALAKEVRSDVVFVGHHSEQTALKRPSPYLLISQDALPSFKKALAQQVLLTWGLRPAPPAKTFHLYKGFP